MAILIYVEPLGGTSRGRSAHLITEPKTSPTIASATQRIAERMGGRRSWLARPCPLRDVSPGTGEEIEIPQWPGPRASCASERFTQSPIGQERHDGRGECTWIFSIDQKAGLAVGDNLWQR